MKSLALVALFTSLAACGNAAKSTVSTAKDSSTELGCDASVPHAVCEGTRYLSKKLQNNPAVNGIGINLGATRIQVATQVQNDAEKAAKLAALDLAVAAVAAADGSRILIDAKDAETRYTYVDIFGDKAPIELTTFGPVVAW